MKKTLLLFAMLLGVVGAWAQPKVSDAPQGDQWNANTTWFVITLKGTNSILTTTFTDNENALKIEGQTTTAPGDGALWCVVGDATNGYKFYNKAIGTSKILGITGSEGGARTRMVADATDGYTTTFDFKSSGVTGGTFWCIKTHELTTTNNYLNNRGGYLALWANNSAYGSNGTGSAFLFEEAVIEELDIEFTDNTGTIHSGMGKCIKNTDGTFNSRFIIAGIPSECLKDVNIENGKYKATLNLPFPVSNAEVTKKMMINGYTYSKQNFKWYAKDNTEIKVNEGSAPTVANVASYLWAIYPSFNDGVFTYAIKNVATGKYITSSATVGAHANNTLGFNETGISFALVKDSWGYAFKVADKILYLSINSSQDDKGEQPLGLHGNTHDGTTLSFIPYVVNYTLTDAANNTYTGEGEGWAGLQIEPVFTGAAGYSLTDKVWDGNTFTATITFPFLVSSETVSNPTMISSYNYNKMPAGNFKWYAEDSKVKVDKEEFKNAGGRGVTSSNVASHLWLIYPNFNNGAFTFQIKNLATGLFINTEASGHNQHNADSKVVLSESPTDYTVGQRGDEGSEFIDIRGLRLSVNTSQPGKDVIQTVGTYNSSHSGTALTFPTPEYAVTIGATGYATLYSPITVRPEDQTLEIYQIESAPENGRIELTQMFHVYKNQGVILKGAEGTYRFGLTEDYWEGFIEDSMWDNNKLKGSFTNTYVQGDAYVLSAPGGVENVGLYKAELNKNANGESGDTHFLNNAGKAYLPVSALTPEAAEARFFVFDFGGNETAIENVEAENAEQNAVVYDLAGRRVQGAQKGIFIVNGKKVVR